MILNILTTIFFLCLISSCSELPSENDPTTHYDIDSLYSISGTVIYMETFTGGVELNLWAEDQIVQQTISGSEGEFTLDDIAEGYYRLTSRLEFDDFSYVENSMDINLSANLELPTVRLPAPVELYQPIEVTWTTATLHWSPSSGPDFQTYDLYRYESHPDYGNAGILVFSSDSAADTTFHHDLSVDGRPSPEDAGYYRIFVTSNPAKISASNILRVTTNRWENEHNFSVNYQINVVAEFTGLGETISGVDFDGEYLWILLYSPIGGYYDPDLINLVKFDPETEEVVQEFEYTDEYTSSPSLAWDGTYLWVNYFDSGRSNLKIKKIDPTDGSIVITYATIGGIQDISSDGQRLFRTFNYDRIDVITTDGLDIIAEFESPYGPYSIGWGAFGISYRPGEIWLTSKWENEFAILDESGNHIGVVYADLLAESQSYNSHLHLCFMSEYLVLTKNSVVYILEIQDTD